MLDPLTALSLAGTIAQFVDFGHKLLRDARELYGSTSGKLTVDEELILITSDLTGLVKKFQQSFKSTSSNAADTVGETERDDNASLEGICIGATKVAEELIARLDRLRGLESKSERSRKWKTIQDVVKRVWSRDEIDRLTRRLSAFTEALEMQILFSIRDELDAQALRISERFNALDKQTQLIISALLSANDASAQLTATISIIASRLETGNKFENRKTRDFISLERLSSGGADIGTITSGIEMLDVTDNQEHDLRRRTTKSILTSLKYTDMSYRYEGVFEAHSNTFEWAFKTYTTEQRPWSDLGEWLRIGKGVYWVAGKPGSGKSTLMKHLFEDARTLQILKEWGRSLTPLGAPLCLATFFFWNSGTAEQKSQAGMLRTLLYQVFEQYPDLIAVVCPAVWASHYSGLAKSKPAVESWSLRDLMAVFKSLLEQESIPLKLCFFIDGLDEFEGDHEELAEIFMQATTNKASYVKACLSSRPLPIFTQVFDGCPSLRLQDLTYLDIEKYVSDKMHRSSAFQRLASRNQEAASMLIQGTVDRAEGIFLWVWLVVKSLLRGIRNLDTISDLWKRLLSIPRELEPLYEHLMEEIEPVYLQWASKAFQIVRACRELSYKPFAGMAVHETTPVSIMPPPTLSLLYFAMNEELRLEKMHEIEAEYSSVSWEEVEIHLAARSMGLLEVTTPPNDRVGPISKVQYLHRTARDFLEMNKQWFRIVAHTSSTDFDPYSALMKSRSIDLRREHQVLLEAKVREITDYGATTKSGIASDFMIFAHHADSHAKTCQRRAAMLENVRMMALDTRLRPIWIDEWSKWLPSIITNAWSTSDSLFLVFSTLFGLSSYIKYKLTQMATHGRKAMATVLLRYLLLLKGGEHPPEGKLMPPLNPEMASTLLQLGANPNWKSSTAPSLGTDWQLTSWQNFLLYALGRGLQNSESMRQEYLPTMKLLLSFGADLRTHVSTIHSIEFSVSKIISELIRPSFSLEGAELWSLLKEKQLQSADVGPLVDSDEGNDRDSDEDHQNLRQKRQRVRF